MEKKCTAWFSSANGWNREMAFDRSHENVKIRPTIRVHAVYKQKVSKRVKGADTHRDSWGISCTCIVCMSALTPPTLCSIWPFLWWPYSNLILSSPIFDLGKMSGIHSIMNGVGDFWSGSVFPKNKQENFDTVCTYNKNNTLKLPWKQPEQWCFPDSTAYKIYDTILKVWVKYTCTDMSLTC